MHQGKTPEWASLRKKNQVPFGVCLHFLPISAGSRKNYAVKQRYINRASSGRFDKGQLSCKKYKGKSIFSNKTREGLALQEKAQKEELEDKDFITVLLISWEVSATPTWDSPLQTPAEPQEDWGLATPVWFKSPSKTLCNLKTLWHGADAVQLLNSSYHENCCIMKGTLSKCIHLCWRDLHCISPRAETKDGFIA